MIPCGAEHIVCVPFSTWPRVPLHIDLADWIRRIGVTVAVVGAFEATPAGTAQLWRKAAERRRQLRGWLARWIPWLRSPRVHITGMSATANVGGKKPQFSGSGTVWNPNAQLWEQTKALYGMHQQLEAHVSDLQREARELTEGVRGELHQFVTELRAATSEITVKIRETEAQAAQADARGIWVVVAGIVLAGVPDGLARWPILGVAVTLGAVAAAFRVGVVVTRSVRTS